MWTYKGWTPRNPSMLRIVLFSLLAATASAADPTEKDFRRASMYILEDPKGDKAEDMAKAIIVFTAQTEKAMVYFGEEETKWTGDNKKLSPILMAAYAAGNVQSQLNSGVLRNDRYAGVISLFGTYRALKEKDNTFKIEAVEELLKKQKDDTLTTYIVELEKKNRTKDPAAPKKRDN